MVLADKKWFIQYSAVRRQPPRCSCGQRRDSCFSFLPRPFVRTHRHGTAASLESSTSRALTSGELDLFVRSSEECDDRWASWPVIQEEGLATGNVLLFRVFNSIGNLFIVMEHIVQASDRFVGRFHNKFPWNDHGMKESSWRAAWLVPPDYLCVRRKSFEALLLQEDNIGEEFGPSKFPHMHCVLCSFSVVTAAGGGRRAGLREVSRIPGCLRPGSNKVGGGPRRGHADSGQSCCPRYA